MGSGSQGQCQCHVAPGGLQGTAQSPETSVPAQRLQTSQLDFMCRPQQGVMAMPSSQKQCTCLSPHTALLTQGRQVTLLLDVNPSLFGSTRSLPDARGNPLSTLQTCGPSFLVYLRNVKCSAGPPCVYRRKGDETCSQEARERWGCRQLVMIPGQIEEMLHQRHTNRDTSPGQAPWARTPHRLCARPGAHRCSHTCA